MCLLNAFQHGKFRSGENPVLAQCVFPWSQRNGSNGFRTIGMLRDPVWANVELRISSAAGALYDGESVSTPA